MDHEAHPELKAVQSTGTVVSTTDAVSFKTRLKNFAKIGIPSKEPSLTKEEEERLVAEYQYTGATMNIHPYLSSLVNYTHPIKFQAFELAERKIFFKNIHFFKSRFKKNQISIQNCQIFRSRIIIFYYYL